ncbi:UNVERIFIED_CONTAM: hypothetical protein K2H54_010893 [Gekko kuhli]
MGALQERFEEFLNRPGLLGDFLSNLEAKSGVKRYYLATGSVVLKAPVIGQPVILLSAHFAYLLQFLTTSHLGSVSV